MAGGCDARRRTRRAPSATEPKGGGPMKTTVIGAYPKNSDERQDLRRALHKVDRGELDPADLERVLDETMEWAVGEIEDAGIDVVNDGQIRWDDLLAPFAAAWRN